MLKKVFIFLTLLLLLNLSLSHFNLSLAANPNSQQEKRLEKIGPGLTALEQFYQQKGIKGAADHALKRRIVLEDNGVEAVLEFAKGWPIDKKKVKSMGGTVGLQYRNHLLVKIPLPQLSAFSSGLKGLDRIRLPYRPHELVESQGVGIMGASDLHTLGYTGQGVKVAIIDSGFLNLTTAQGAGLTTF